MSPNVTHATLRVSVSTSIVDTLTYGKKTDQEVLEPTNDVGKGGTMLIWWAEKPVGEINLS